MSCRVSERSRLLSEKDSADHKGQLPNTDMVKNSSTTASEPLAIMMMDDAFQTTWRSGLLLRTCSVLKPDLSDKGPVAPMQR
jgi:hypothetical protein